MHIYYNESLTLPKESWEAPCSRHNYWGIVIFVMMENFVQTALRLEPV